MYIEIVAEEKKQDSEKHIIEEIGVRVLKMKINPMSGTAVWRLKFFNEQNYEDLTCEFMGTGKFNQKNVRLADGSINLESMSPKEDLEYIKKIIYPTANLTYYENDKKYMD